MYRLIRAVHEVHGAMYRLIRAVHLVHGAMYRSIGAARCSRCVVVRVSVVRLRFDDPSAAPFWRNDNTELSEACEVSR
jgi:hypothetical protein